MPGSPDHVLICSCEDTMPLDIEAVRRGCPGKPVTTARQLCRSEVDRFRALAGEAQPLTVGCTQEAALFADMAAEIGRAGAVNYVNIRETAGWSGAAAGAGPKMAALLAAAAEPAPDVSMLAIESGGVILVYGRGEGAVEAGNLLKDHLDVTVLIAPPATVMPRRTSDFPVVQGKSERRPDILAHSTSSSTISRSRRHRRGAHCRSAPRAMARARAAILSLISPAARRCFPQPICATAIRAPIPAILPRCCRQS